LSKLLSEKEVKREYCEAGYLKHYIFRWHGDLIPDCEKYPREAYFREAVPSASAKDIVAILSDDDQDVSTPDMEKTLLAAWDTFNAELCRRIIARHKLKICRCPQCNRILESPKARLCHWCDFNEYASDNNAMHVEPAV